MPERQENDLTNNIVVITGASAGVGRAVAHRFARAGTSLALIARDEASLEETKLEVESLGGRAAIFPADVADADAVFAAAEAIEDQLGPIETWVNNAMTTVFSPLSKMKPEEFRRVTEVTYLGFVYGTMAALRHMQPRARGTIVQVGSALAYRGIPLQSAYCGAKHAIRGFTDSLRSELLHDGSRIRLTMVHLPAINTPQFDWARAHIGHEPRPVAPVFQPGVAADAIFEAAQSAPRELWVGSSTSKVILGNMISPRFLDHYLARNAYHGQETAAPLQPGRDDNLFRPVPQLHRTRGSFSREASTSAVNLPGEAVRFAAVVIGVGLAATAGFFTHSAWRSSGRPRRSSWSSG
ncbi:SDR family oxidoreductase [Mesorhizobium sp. WSM2239]|uniref:SDR family oxidoreductase n=2 Tax=unclassified Mesorhizobium TaxID=325217 RepID=A0AAU8D174_9HYPH